jgi:RNase P subunit RPR2
MTTPDGPIDRFAASKKQQTRKKIAELERHEGLTEDQAIKRAEEGKEFLCKNCRAWWPRAEFEYVYNGETKLASRCKSCRDAMRQLYRRRR